MADQGENLLIPKETEYLWNKVTNVLNVYKITKQMTGEHKDISDSRKAQLSRQLFFLKEIKMTIEKTGNEQ